MCRIIGLTRRKRRYASTAGGPFPDFGVNRNNFYGLVNRDFYRTKQDIGTINGEIKITPDLTLSNKTRMPALGAGLHRHASGIADHSTSPNPAFGRLSANPQSRYQVTEILANQTELTYKFDTLRLEAHRARRRRSLARDLSSSTNIPASARKRSPVDLGERIHHRRQRLLSAIHVPSRWRRRRRWPACRPRSPSTPRASTSSIAPTTMT